MKKLRGNSLLFVLLIFLCSTNPALNQDDEGVVKISEAEIEGREAIAEKEIKENIGTEFPSIKPWVKDPEFNEEILKEDMIRIERLYENYGYYDVNAEYKLTYNDKKDEVEITINIKEGKPVILTELNIDIQKELDEGVKMEILGSVPLRVDETFSPTRYQETKGIILDILSNNGRPKSSIEGEALVNRVEKSAKVNFRVAPGSLYRFGSISVKGNEDVETKIIRREVTFEEGEVYSTTKLDETRARIFQLGLFSSVVTEIDFDESEKNANTTIRVEQRKFGTVKIGLGFGTEDLFRGQIILTQRNFFGDGRRFEAAGKFSFLTQRIETSLTQPYILGGGSELTGLFSLRRDDLPGFTSENILGSLGVKKEFAKTFNAFGSFNVLASSLSNVSDISDVSDSIDETQQCENNCFLTFFNAVVERNTTDDIFNPTRGSVASVGLESSFKTLGSEVNYLKGTAELRGYKRLFKVVFAARFLLGIIEPFGTSRTFDVPIFKRFFAGGSTTHRGFPFQKLGPIDDDEDPLGGNSLLLGSFESRFPIYKDLGCVVFFDYGNVYSEEFDYSLDDIKYAVGVGLRYSTPIGPVRADLGYALNPEPEFGRLQFFFSIGQAF